MKITPLMFTIVTLLSITIFVKATKKRPSCAVCRELVANFKRGLDQTKKKNYGGGNTDWEESRLGQYANSEVRLVEIMDELCVGASKECPPMLEENEELIEEFWFKSGLEKVEDEFFRFFCVENLQACCPNNTYGPECTECIGGKERPCRGNGDCEGQGTREGTGECKCRNGYTGTECESCDEGYYESLKNDTHTICKVCHHSCDGKCRGSGPHDCEACKEGWETDGELGCRDVDECEHDDVCTENNYCVNTAGSYTCLSCNIACKGCDGPGYDKCHECQQGFLKNETDCIDINECESDNVEQFQDLCPKEGERCVNTAGAYKCVCRSGYMKSGDSCILRPEKKPVKILRDNPDSDNPHNSNPHPRDDSQLTRQEANLVTLMIGFSAIGLLFFVIGRLFYLINPYLLSIPVCGFAIIAYYLIDSYED